MTGSSKRLYLASASPRRVALLAQMGLSATQYPVRVDETPDRGELPRVYAARMARLKIEAACAALQDNPDVTSWGAVVIAADTVVSAGRRIFAKTDDPDRAIGYLQTLSGRRHRVYGALAVAEWRPDAGDWRIISRLSMTRVQFSRLTDADIREYLATNQWPGCAGGYAVQGLAGRWVKQISGSYTNVVGLDIHQLSQVMKSIHMSGNKAS